MTTRPTGQLADSASAWRADASAEDGRLFDVSSDLFTEASAEVEASAEAEAFADRGCLADLSADERAEAEAFGEGGLIAVPADPRAARS